MAYTKKQWEKWKLEHPDEWQNRAEKIARSHKGKKLSAKHKAAIAKAMRGRKLPLKHRKKIAESVKITRNRHAEKETAVGVIGGIAKRIGWKTPVYAVGILAITLILAFGLTNLGLFAKEDWTKHWEGMKDLTVDNNLEYVTTHVIFGLYKPENCEDGIQVTANDQNVSFEILNPILDNESRCSETDIRFKNIIYGPTAFEIEFVAPTPEDGAVIEESHFMAKVYASEGTNFTLLEWKKGETASTAVMSGFGMDWEYNLTDLENGTYSYRAFATNVTGETISTDYRTITIGTVQAAANATENATQGGTETAPNATVILPNVTENITQNATEAPPNVTESAQPNATEGNATESETPGETAAENSTENITAPTGGAVTPPRVTYYIYYGRKPPEVLKEVTFADPTPGQGQNVTVNWAFINATTDEPAELAVLEWSDDKGNTTTIAMSGEGQEFWYNLTDLDNGAYTFSVLASAYNKTVVSESRMFTIAVEAPKEYETQITQGKAVTGQPVEWTGYIKVRNDKNTTKIKDLKNADFTLPADAINSSVKERGNKQKAGKEKAKVNKLKVEGEVDVPALSEVTYDVNYETPAPQQIEQTPVDSGVKWAKHVTVSANVSVEYTNVVATTDVKKVKPNLLKLYRTTGGGRTDVTADPAYGVQMLDDDGDGLIERMQWTVPHLSDQDFDVEAYITILNVQSYPVVGGNWTVRFTTVGTADLSIRAVDGTTWSNYNEDNDLKLIEIKCGNNVLDYQWLADTGTAFISNYSCNDVGYETSNVLTAGRHNLAFTFGNDTEYAHNLAQSNPVLNSTDGANLTVDTFTCWNQSTVGGMTNIYNWYKNNKGEMILYMPFDSDNSGGAGIVKDYSGNGYNGPKNQAEWTSSGKIGGAYFFNGTKITEYVNSTDIPYFNGANTKLTLSFWVNMTDVTTSQIVIGKYDITTSPQHRTFVVQIFTGKVRFVAYSDGDATNYVLYDSGAVLSTNTWTHIVGVYDLSAQNIDIYINGAKTAATVTTSGTPPTTFGDTATPVVIGRGMGTALYLNGTLDDVRMYGSALSAAQILQLYSDTKNGYSSNQTYVSNGLLSGDQLICEVTANDGSSDTAPLNSSALTITSYLHQWSPMLTATSSPYNLTVANLTCYNQSTVGSVSNIYNWYVNGTSIMLLNMPFDNNSATGQNVSDYSGWNNSGVNNSNVTWVNLQTYGMGRVGGGYLFQNNSPGTISLNSTNKYLATSSNTTIMAWVRLNTSFNLNTCPSACGRTIFNAYKDDSNRGSFYFSGDTSYVGRVAAGLVIGGTGYTVYTTQNVWAANQWYHVAFTTGTGEKLYINGSLAPTQFSGSDTTSSWNAIAPTDTVLGGGTYSSNARPDKKAAFFNGTIDDFRIYNRTLNAVEIEQIYKETSTNFTNNATIVANETKPWENWTCEVRAASSTNETAPLNSSTAQVMAAYQTAPLLNASSTYNVTADNVTCYNQSTVGAVTNTFNWYRNDTSYLSLLLPFDYDNSGGSRKTKNYANFSGPCDLGTAVANDVSEPRWVGPGGPTGLRGKVGGAYAFDGVNDYINCTNSTATESTTNLTVEAWIWPNVTSGAGYTVIERNQNWLMEIGTGRLYFETVASDNAYHNVWYVPTITEAAWTHVVATISSDDLNTRVHIYLNGVDTAVTVSGYTGGWNDAGINGTVIGIRSLGYDYLLQPFNGTIDEVRVYNRTTLSAQQVWQRYVETKDGYQRNSTMVGWYTNRPGDQWTCEVTPTDAWKGDGTTLNSTELQMYDKTYQNNPWLNATSLLNSTADNLTCYNQTTSWNVRTNVYNWYVNNRSILGLNMPFDTTTLGFTCQPTIQPKDYAFGNNATLYDTQHVSYGCAINTPGGPRGTYINFTRAAATDRNVTVPTSGNITFANATTIEFWAMPMEGGVGGQYFFAVDKLPASKGQNGYQVYLYTGSGFYCRVNTTVGNGYLLSSVNSNLDYSDNAWHHIACTWDDSTGKLIIYQDGVQQAVTTGATGYMNSNSYNLTIGNNCTPGSPIPNQAWGGGLDEIRLYSVALSPAQVYQRYIETKNNYTNQTIVSGMTSNHDTWICGITPTFLDTSRSIYFDGLPLNSTPLTLLGKASDPCAQDSDCASGYCRVTPEGGKYCANASTLCVMYMNRSIQQNSSMGLFPVAESDADKAGLRCYNGYWSEDPYKLDVNTTYVDINFTTYGGSIWSNSSAKIKVPLNAFVSRARLFVIGDVSKPGGQGPQAPSIDVGNKGYSDWALPTPTHIRDSTWAPGALSNALASNSYVAQSFTTDPNTAGMARIMIALEPAAGGKYINFEIWGDTAGVPDKNKIVYRSTYAANTLPLLTTSAAQINIPGKLIPMTQYWMVAYGPTGGGGDGNWHQTTNAVGLYAGKAMSSPDGVTWADVAPSGRDMAFEIFSTDQLIQSISPYQADIWQALQNMTTNGSCACSGCTLTDNNEWCEIPLNVTIQSVADGELILDPNVEYLLTNGTRCNDDRECASGYCRSDYTNEKFCSDNSTNCVHNHTLTASQGQMGRDYADRTAGSWWCQNGRWARDPFNVSANYTYTLLNFTNNSGRDNSTVIKVPKGQNVVVANMSVVGKGNLSLVVNLTTSASSVDSVNITRSDASYVYVGTGGCNFYVFTKDDWTQVNKSSLLACTSPGGITSMAVDDDYLWFGTVYTGTSITQISKKNWNFTRTLTTPSSGPSAMVTDMNYLYVATDLVEIFNKSTGVNVANLSTNDGGTASALAVDADHVYVGTTKGNVTVYSKYTDEPEMRFVACTNVSSISADYDYLFVACANTRNVTVYQKPSFTPITNLSSSTANITGMAEDNKYLYVAGNNVSLFDKRNWNNTLNLSGTRVWRDKDYVYTSGNITGPNWGVNVNKWWYPTNPKIDVGSDQTIDWSYAGEFNQTVSPRVVSFASALNSLASACTCQGCAIYGSYCTVNINVSSNTSGTIELSNLDIQYSGLQINNVNVTPNNPTIASELTCNANITNLSSKWIRMNVTWYNDTQHITAFDENAINCFNANWCSGTVKLLAGNYTTKGGNITCQVTAYDDQGGISMLNGTVTIGNSCPLWNPTPSNQYAGVNTQFYYQVNATDVDSGDTLSFVLNDTSYSMNSSTGVMNKTFAAPGSNILFINATDGTCTINATVNVSTRNATGDPCSQDSDCASGYCRHDYDWSGIKKMCAGPLYDYMYQYGYSYIYEPGCVRSFPNGTTNLSIDESGANTPGAWNYYGFLPNISQSVYPQDTMDAEGTTFSGDPSYFCYDGHWSEDPIIAPMKSYSAEHPYGIASSSSQNSLHSRTYNDLYFYDNTSSDISTQLRVAKIMKWVNVSMEISGYNVTEWMPNLAVAPPKNPTNTTYQNSTYAESGMAYCNGKYYAVMVRIGYQQSYLMVKSSVDGSRNWVNESYPEIRSNAQPRAPAIACNGSSIYVVWSNNTGNGYNGGASGSVMFSSSSDGAVTWSAPINITPEFYDSGNYRRKELDVYVNNLNVLFQGAPTVDGGLSWPSIIRSTDAGITWQTVNTTPNYPAAQTWQFPHMERYNSSMLAATGFAANNGTQIMFSNDNGATWGPLRTIFNGTYYGERMLPYFKISNVSGTMTYTMVFGDDWNQAGIPYFNYSMSTDGITWNTPVKLEGYPPLPSYPMSYVGWPRLARVNNTVVVILEHINVNGCGYKCTYETSSFYYIYSTNNGTTWSTVTPVGNPPWNNYISSGFWDDQPTVLMPTTNSTWAILWHYGPGQPDQYFGDMLFSRFGAITGFPENINLTIGGTNIFTRQAVLTEALSPLNVTNFSTALRTTAAACTCNGCVDQSNYCIVPINVTSTVGKIILDNLIAYGTNNTAPTHNNPWLNSTDYPYNRSSGNLTCYNQSTSDADGDPNVTNIYNWYKNGTSVMVLNMPFDTAVITTDAGAVKDYSGQNDTGTLGGGTLDYTPMWTPSGKVGGAYVFDGFNDYIDLAKPDQLNFKSGANFTISAWVYILGSVGTYRPIVNKGDHQYGLKVYTDNKFEFCIYDTNWVCVYSDSATTTGTWYHVVGVANSTYVAMWVNGAKQAQTSAHSSINDDGYNVNIGRDAENPTRLFNGTIDNVQIYNRSLSTQQVERLYADTANGYSNLSVIVQNELTPGDNWTCEVTPSDSAADGTTKNSTSLYVWNGNLSVDDTLVDDSLLFPYNQIDLYGGTTKSVICNATVVDTSGLRYLSTVSGQFYNSGASKTYGCTLDNNNCYTNTSCAWLAQKNITARYAECTFQVWYMANNSTGTGWTCNITASDILGLTANRSDTTDINPLSAVGAPTTIPFGSLAVGGTSADDVNASMQNYGNVRMDLALNGSSLTCTIGTIAASDLHYNCTNYTQNYDTFMAYLSPGAITGSTATANCTGFDLAKNSTATTEQPIAPTKNLPWKIKIPTAVGGNCQGTVWFAAVAG